jgi:RNA polymerase sigma-70 factor, ECF subfamily
MIAPPHAADRTSPPRWVALVEAAQQGDRQAFSRLHREFGAMVHGLLLARVDPATADDLTQDVFLLAWQRIDRLHEPRAWPSWLATIARNRAIDHLRVARRPGTLPPEIPSSSPDPLVRTEAERLRALICELPEALVEPLILRLVEGLSGPEIAERTGLSPGYVRVNLHRGMKLLRQRLGQIGETR